MLGQYAQRIFIKCLPNQPTQNRFEWLFGGLIYVNVYNLFVFFFACSLSNFWGRWLSCHCEKSNATFRWIPISSIWWQSKCARCIRASVRMYACVHALWVILVCVLFSFGSSSYFYLVQRIKKENCCTLFKTVMVLITQFSLDYPAEWLMQPYLGCFCDKTNTHTHIGRLAGPSTTDDVERAHWLNISLILNSMGDEVLIYVLSCAVELGIFDEWQRVANGWCVCVCVRAPFYFRI